MNFYLGLFLIAFAALTLEISLVRLLSVTSWYYLAFYAISVAMLGMTAGATGVYLNPAKYSPDNLGKALATGSIGMALAIPLALAVLCLVPLNLLDQSVMGLLALLLSTVACALPYFFAGTIVSAVLTKHVVPIGGLYASDLLGAALGCLFALGGLQLFDAPSLIVLCGFICLIAAVCFAWKSPEPKLRRAAWGLAGVFLFVGLINPISSAGIRPVIVKGSRIEPATKYDLERWNSFSRVAVYPLKHEPPLYWGPSPLAPADPVDWRLLNIDGDAGTPITRCEKLEDLDYLRYDVTNLGYWLEKGGEACVIGVGGGRDLQTALLFGHEGVTGVELNPIFIDLLENEFRDFAGLAERDNVRLVKSEARLFLSVDQRKYNSIQMSLIDTWAATGAGAFSLSENSLYTVEAWKTILSRLDEGGVFSVSRWHSPENIGESSRIVSLAVATLLELGVEQPSKHIVLVSSGRIATLLVSPDGFSEADAALLQQVCERMQFKPIHLPGWTAEHGMLDPILSAARLEELNAATAGMELNCSPPRDASPYFFNMLRISDLFKPPTDTGVVSGNLLASRTLMMLMLTLAFTCYATIVLPLVLKQRLEHASSGLPRSVWYGAFYFSLIGCGFMLTEIALIQRLTVLLTHPIYALGILLFTLIASTGVGSLLSDRLPLTKRPWLTVYPLLTVVMIIVLNFVLNSMLSSMTSASIPARIAASMLVIFPMGLLMGMFFPAGMRLAKEVSTHDTPWYWALNGVFGVLCSAVAVFVSIYVGISVNFYIAAACYALVPLTQAGMLRGGTAQPSVNEDA